MNKELKNNNLEQNDLKIEEREQPGNTEAHIEEISELLQDEEESVTEDTEPSGFQKFFSGMKSGCKKIKNIGYYKVKGCIGITFTALMLSVFPLFYTNRYYNIRHDRLHMYYILCSVLMVAGTVALMIFDNRTKEQKLKDKFKISDLSIVDWSIIAFTLAAIISTIFSEYPISSLTGSAGRNNGLVLILTYAEVYFIISRSFKATKVIPMLVCLVSSIISIITVLHEFYIDPLNLYAGIGGEQAEMFVSTLGNRNILSAFLCIVFPICLLVFMYATDRYELVFSGVSCVIVYGGIMCSSSDNSLLGLVFLIIFCLLIFIRSFGKLAKFFILCGFMLLGCKAIRLLSYFMDDHFMKFSKVQKILVYYRISYILIGFCFALGITFLILHKRNPRYVAPRKVRHIAVFITILIFVGIAMLLVYYSVFDTETKLKSILKYFRFNDDWGTHRGFMWKRAIYIYLDLNIFSKLFGTGPDTFRKLMDLTGYNYELYMFKGEVTDCAHNVYLNYLITLGFTGTVSFITAIVSSIVRSIKRASNKYTVIFAGSVLCYAVQASVNIDQPITTPLFMLMLALAESQNRITPKKKKAEKAIPYEETEELLSYQDEDDLEKQDEPLLDEYEEEIEAENYEYATEY